MDKNKEVNKRSPSDCKKVGYSKSKNSHINIPSGASKNKISYISRAKNASIPLEKKNIYATDTKSFLKQTSDQCRLGASAHLVNTTSVNHPTQLTNIDVGHDFNGNLPFNPHTPFCNISTVHEIPNFNKVLSYATDHHYELSVQKSTKNKSRPSYHEESTFNSKVHSSSNSFSSNKFFSAVPHSTISYCSKSTPRGLSNNVPFLKLPTNRICSETTVVREKYNSKCLIESNELVTKQLETDIKVSNFPVFAQSNLPQNACLTFQVDYPENQLQDINKPDYFLQKWEQISVASLFENPKDLKNSDKIIFPALPSNVQNQEMKNDSACPRNMLQSELSCGEHSDLESANSISKGITTNIPQASYADVIRMSATCDNSLVLDKISEHEQNSVGRSEKKDEISQSGSSDWVISRLSQLDQQSQDSVNIALANNTQSAQNSVTPNPIVVSLEKPSFYNSTLHNSKNVSASLIPLLPCEQTEKVDECANNLYSFENMDKMSSSSSAYSCSIPSDIVASVDAHAVSSKTDSICSSASSVSSSNNAFKPIRKKVLNKTIFQNERHPVIIMNNCSPPDGLSDISFGIEYEEMVKLCFDSCDVLSDNDSNLVQSSDECSLSERSTQTLNSHLEVSEIHVSPDSNSVCDSKSRSEKVVKIKLKNKDIFWKESDVNFDHSNQMQLIEYVSSLWKECEKDSVPVWNECEKDSVPVWNECEGDSDSDQRHSAFHPENVHNSCFPTNALVNPEVPQSNEVPIILFPPIQQFSSESVEDVFSTGVPSHDKTHFAFHPESVNFGYLQTNVPVRPEVHHQCIGIPIVQFAPFQQFSSESVEDVFSTCVPSHGNRQAWNIPSASGLTYQFGRFSIQNEVPARRKGAYSFALNGKMQQCNLCRQNGESPSVYLSHRLKDNDGTIRCPVLRANVCKICGETGDKAHTESYCPYNRHKNIPLALKLKTTIRDSTGRKRKPHLFQY